MWKDVFDLIFAGADDRNLAAIRRDLPFNLVGGEKDPATDGGKAVIHLAERLQRMGFQDIQASHLTDTRHESLNEVNRDTVMADFGAWLDRVVR
jgi:alpha-beta hydrolase superfamily lysophospholipase